MELTSEIRSLLTADPILIESVELTYPNGGVVTGSIKKLRRRPLKVLIRKENPAKGESPEHRIRFEHVSSMKIILVDGSVKKF